MASMHTISYEDIEIRHNEANLHPLKDFQTLDDNIRSCNRNRNENFTSYVNQGRHGLLRVKHIHLHLHIFR
jgi:hypothetical protein